MIYSHCDINTSISNSAATRNANDASERDQYILQLEKRVRDLEHARHPHSSLEMTSSGYNDATKSGKLMLSTSELSSTYDYMAGDLACHIAQATVGRRVTSPHLYQHPLEAHIRQAVEAEGQGQAIFHFSPNTSQTLPKTSPNASSSSHSGPVFEHGEEFRMDFNSTEGPQTLDAIIDILPTQAQLEVTSAIFFHSLNSWLPTVHEAQWKIDIQKFWSEHDLDILKSSPPVSSELQFVACILAIAGHGLLRLEPSSSLFVATEEERNWLANVWLKASLRILILGEIFLKPTIYGIRALGLLSSVEIS